MNPNCHVSKRNLFAKALLAIACVLVPFLAGADPLALYGSLTGKTVLMPRTIPSLPDSILSGVVGKTNAIAKIEGELSNRGMVVIPDGPHFVRILSRNQTDSLTNAPLRGAALASSQYQTGTNTGEVEFRNLEPEQVLGLLAAVSHRTVLRPDSLPEVTLSLTSACPLSSGEAVYAMETVLALNGFAVVEDGQRFVQVMPAGFHPHTGPNTPKPEPGAEMFDPNKPPSTGASASQKPVSKMEREYDQWQRTFYNFIHYKGPPDRSAQHLLELYANLSSKKAEPSEKFNGAHIWFHIGAPLSKNELEYAIVTTFMLNNLAIIPMDTQRIRLGDFESSGEH